MANILRRWTRTRRAEDMRDGDPYLEAIGRRLALLGGGETVRRFGYAGRRV